MVLSAGILIWGQLDLSPSADHTHQSVNLPVNEASGDVSSGFFPPSVFPVTDNFHTEVVKGSAYTKLNPYTPLDVTNQLGRPDPFRSY